SMVSRPQPVATEAVVSELLPVAAIVAPPTTDNGQRTTGNAAKPLPNERLVVAVNDKPSANGGAYAPPNGHTKVPTLAEMAPAPAPVVLADTASVPAAV